MFLYIFTLKHDKGIIKIQVNASSIESAIHTIMNSEGCPERAIKSIKVLRELK